MNGETGRSIYHAIKIQFDRYGKNARLSRGVRFHDMKRNFIVAKEGEKVLPERCYALVDKTGLPFKYVMMTHAEAKKKNKQTSLMGYRWTQCTPKNLKLIQERKK